MTNIVYIYEKGNDPMTDTARLTPEEIAELRERRRELMDALTSGVAQVSHNGKTVTFRSLDDIKAALASLDAALGLSPTRVVKTVTRRGL